jgi:DNA-binding SARP family transcriptional activator/tetratricopeptide (TPR) repeat protein
MRLLGQFAAELDDATVHAPSSRRAWGVLAWLALHPGLHPRGDLAARFWPDVLDASAKASLRSALWALRRALGPAGAAYLSCSRDLVGLRPDTPVQVDALVFDTLVAAGRLEEAAAMAAGEFLTGFDDEWVLEARDEHRAKLADLLEQLASTAVAGGDLRSALQWTRRQAAVDPLAEEPQRRLMERLAAAGDPAAALAGYERFRQRLDRELGMAPSLPTRRLAQALQETRGPRQPLPPSPAYQRRPPMVGRERELDTLLTAWREAQAGRGGVVTITGEPGIGKTRLAVELAERARADGAHTASCAALDLGGAAPLGLWAELIGELGQDLAAPPPDAMWPSVLAPIAPDLERRLGREPARRISASPDRDRARLFEAMVALLDWACRRPLVLLLEDLHLADTTSLHLAGYVARRAIGMPLLMILTRRPLPRRAEADALEHAVRSRGALLAELTLGPLPGPVIARLVRELTPLPAADVDHVVAAAEGNPLIAVEWSRALGRGERGIPGSLRGPVRAALAHLADDQLLLAQFAAAAGRDLSRDETAALPLPSPADAAAGALESGLLVAAHGRIGYRHALLRETVYDDLAEPRRARLHEQLATALATRQDDNPRLPAEIARHLRLAGRDDLAVAQLVRAAAHARAVAALAEAAGFLEEAAGLAPADAVIAAELAEVQAWRGREEASDMMFGRAAAILEQEPEPLARAWVRRANWYRGALCHPRRVLESARQAVKVLDAAALPAPEIRVEAQAAWAWAETVAGDADIADQLLSQVRAGLDPRRETGLLTSLVEHALALSLIRRGRFEESYQPQIVAAAACQRAERPDLSYGCWINAACAAACVADFGRALEFIDQGVAALSGSGLATLEVHFLAARAHVLRRIGRLEEARAAAENERRLAERLDNPALLATSDHDLGLIWLASGDCHRAARLLAAALEHHAPVNRPLARLALAEALVGMGRCDEAEEQLRATALEPLRPSHLPETLVPRLTRLQGLIAAARGDVQLAVRRLDEAAAGWRRLLDRAGQGDHYVANLADFGRPPVAGLVEPARELEQVLADLESLHATHA